MHLINITLQQINKPFLRQLVQLLLWSPPYIYISYCSSSDIFMPHAGPLLLFTYFHSLRLSSLQSNLCYPAVLPPLTNPSRLLSRLFYYSSLTTPLSNLFSQPASFVGFLCRSSHLSFRTLNYHFIEQVEDQYLLQE